MKEAHCTIQVSADKLEAYLNLSSEDGNELIPLDEAAVSQQLQEKGIIVGVDHDAISQAVTHLSQNQESSRKFLVAATPGISEVPLPVDLLFSEVPTNYEVQHEDGNSVILSFMQVILVHPHTVLARPYSKEQLKVPQDIYGNDITPQDKSTEIRPVAGENVEYCKKTGVFTSTISGYPGIERCLENGVELLTIFVTPILQVTPDAMLAHLSLRPPPKPHSLTLEEVVSVLDSERVVFGRLEKKLQTALETINHKQQPVEVTAAMGVKTQDGQDAKLKFRVEVGPLPGKERGDGSVDFRERKMFVGVSMDELIAVKIPLTAGKAGRNIHGDEIAPSPGKDFNLKVTDDAVYNQETNEIRATRSGVLSLVTENSVKVCAKQVVSGDVDYNTGNIISRDAVEITGSVKPKFKVIGVGDLTIGGNVEKAALRSDANVIIKGGVLGSRSKVFARGDVDIVFLENGRVFARHNIILRKSGYYCRLHAWKDILCPPEAKIIAAQVIGAGSLTLGNVGSENADKAVIGAGVDPDRLQLYYDYQRAVNTIEEEYDQLCQLYGAQADKPTLLEARQELKKAQKMLRGLNMDNEETAEGEQQNSEQLNQQTITVTGTVFQGTEVRIGNTMLILDETMSKVRFHLTYSKNDETDGAYCPTITATPL